MTVESEILQNDARILLEQLEDDEQTLAEWTAAGDDHDEGVPMPDFERMLEHLQRARGLLRHLLGYPPL